MELIDLENIAQREKINIINFKMKKTKARIINYNNTYIFMDYSEINTYTEEKCLLAEELGHYYYSAYYALSSDQNFIDKQEFKAKKWAFKTLVSPDKIKDLVSKGITYTYEIADELGVTENMLKLACQYYAENNYI